jgi:NAD(P)-dependent dehydrogenase (short-subunit alcohol dehydrogenase family)
MSFAHSLFSLEGKNAVVTGAASGLGRHCAATLAQAAAAVALLDVNAVGLTEAAAEVAALGGRALPLEADVTDAGAVGRTVARVAEGLGPIHILLNCAGIALWKSALEVTEAEWDRLIAVDLKGTWLMAQAVARHMIARRVPGSIINVSSVDSHRVQLNLAPYCAAKAGVNHLTRALAYELAPHRIRVNTLAPGGMLTAMVKEFLETPDGRAAVWTVPFKRFAELHELDGPLLLLASDASGYMTGSVLTVDGGLACSALQYPEH